MPFDHPCIQAEPFLPGRASPDGKHRRRRRPWTDSGSGNTDTPPQLILIFRCYHLGDIYIYIYIYTVIIKKMVI